MTKFSKFEQEEGQRMLEKFVAPGDTLHTILKNVSSSGMSRHIQVVKLVIDEQGKVQVYDLSRLIAKVMGWRLEKRGDYLLVSGCGMDMHFHIVYELGRVLYPDGFNLAKGQYGRNGDKSGYDTDGGYAFKKESL